MVGSRRLFVGLAGLPVGLLVLALGLPQKIEPNAGDGLLPAVFHVKSVSSPDESVIEKGGFGANLRIESDSLGKGGTLAGTLERLGVDRSLAARSVSRASTLVDLRRLPTRTGVSVGRGPSGELISIGIRDESASFVRLELQIDTDEMPIERVVLPVRTTVETIVGTVESSVGQALATDDVGHSLTPIFADIFQWDIDLLVEPRVGDVVRVVYEQRHLGRVPADLPPFGNAANTEGDSLGLGSILAASYDGKLASSTAFLVMSDEGDGGYFDADGQPLQKSFLKSPLNYRRISSGFSRARRHPVTRKVVPHHGVDFAARPGTPVVATADGRIVSAGWDGPLGRAVRIRHGSEYVTVYGHLRGMAKGIRRGAAVKQNQVIGYVGSSGRATGPHLHYTMIHGGRPIDPMRFKNPPAEPLPDALRPAFEQARADMSPVLGALVPRSSGTALADLSEPVAETGGPGV